MKKSQLIRIVLVSIVLATSSCKNEEAKTAFDLVKAKSDIEARSKIYVEALNNKDSIGLANCYTAEAKFMAPNEKSVMGRTNIQKLISQWMKAGMPDFSIETIEVWGNEEVLAAEENWSFKDKNGKIVDQGKALEVYKKEDGVWKLHRDCFNSDLPCSK